MDRLFRLAATLSNWSFNVSAALYPTLMLVVVANVTLRYGFSIGLIELEELQWHIYSAAFLLAIPHVFNLDKNIRVDFLAKNFSSVTKARIEFWATLFLLIPFLVLFSYYSYLFFERSLFSGERSMSSSGLPARYIIKFILFFSMSNLLLQVGVSLLRGLMVPATRQKIL